MRLQIDFDKENDSQKANTNVEDTIPPPKRQSGKYRYYS